jgi:hypothetical protein
MQRRETRRLIIACLLSLCSLDVFSQSEEKTLEKLRDSLSLIEKRRQQKINNFRNSARTQSDFLIVDIDKRNNPVYRIPLNANAGITTGASKLHSGAIGLKLEGQNFLIGLWDDGKVSSHIEFGNRIISNEVENAHDHSTHVAGTLIAEGVNPLAKGMSPRAKIASFYFDNDEVEMAAQAKTDQTSLLFSNHSYGQPTGWYKDDGVLKWAGDPSISVDEDFNFGFYGERASVIDQIAFLAPYYSIVWAAGNDRAEPGNGTHPPDCNSGTGYDCIIPDAVGKNIITVGAVDKVLSYTNPASVAMSYFSSWGPTDDGRIKPDLVGDGVSLFSSVAGGVNTYAMLGGTSMATPNVAGSLVLVQELYSKLHGGKLMKASTLKALAIHTARESGNFPGPDYSYGWGLLNVEAAANLLLREDRKNNLIIESNLKQGETKEWVLTPKPNQKITATIVWSDPAGTPVAVKLDPTNRMLVNDLDIKISDADGNEFFPWTLNPMTPSQAATRGNNDRDNVEKIEFDFPLQKTYKVVVSHKGQLKNGHQDFSLIISYNSSNQTAQTFYWIGDEGDWDDPLHWSSSSGGPPANKTPLENDKIIVDENSFDGIGFDNISLSADKKITTVKWVASNPSGLSLNEKRLTISESLIIASSSFQFSNQGEVILNSSGNGEISFTTNNLGPIDIKIAQGNWFMSGDASFSNLNLEAGKLEISQSNLQLKNLLANSATDKNLVITSSKITISEGSALNKDKLTLAATSSQIKTSSSVVLNWNGIVWPGIVEIAGGKTIINGDNFINSILLSGELETHGSNQLDTLKIKSGSKFLLGQSTQQKIYQLEIEGNSLMPIKILGNQNSSLLLTAHKKFCFDYLNVENVEAEGIAVLNAGENGILVNSPGWYSKKCSDVLLADFDAKYPCENGMTEFSDKSVGSPQQWRWNFPESKVKEGEKVEFSFLKPGTYLVTLTVTNSTESNSYTKEILISQNSLPSNQVLVNQSELFSLQSSAIYKWYSNGSPIPFAANRNYSYPVGDAIYSVLTYDNKCNRMSEALVITNVNTEETDEIKIYPNPASSELTIQLHEGKSATIQILNLIGQVLRKEKLEGGKLVIPVSNFTEGLYIVEVHQEKIVRKRIRISLR